MYLSDDKKTFIKISILYAVALIVFSLTAIQFYDPTEYITHWMVFFVMTLSLTVGYFQLLQTRIKRIESSIVSIAGVCLMGGIAIGILTLLIIGAATFQPYMLTIFSGINITGAIWIAKRLWTQIETRG